tara:strand:+ start:4713 stop:5462 length:750 start_codon:yes stop_codon:yes gene_type:complete
MIKKAISFLFIFFTLQGVCYGSDDLRSILLLDYAGSTSSLTAVENKVRNAAVKVQMQSGAHGSGTYVTIHGFHVIMTAAHVVSDGARQYLVIGENERVIGHLIYKDDDIDVAALLISSMKSRVSMKYSPTRDAAAIGTQIVYSGFPSSHSLLTIRGMISGYEEDKSGNEIIILHSYGWFGCSGSGVYDANGNFVGVLWGIDVQRRQGTHIIEDIIWVTPSSSINEDEILRGICRSILTSSRVCQDLVAD